MFYQYYIQLIWRLKATPLRDLIDWSGFDGGFLKGQKEADDIRAISAIKRVCVVIVRCFTQSSSWLCSTCVWYRIPKRTINVGDRGRFRDSGRGTEGWNICRGFTTVGRALSINFAKLLYLVKHIYHSSFYDAKNFFLTRHIVLLERRSSA